MTIDEKKKTYVICGKTFNIEINNWKMPYKIGLGKGNNCWDIIVCVFEENKFFKNLWNVNTKDYIYEAEEKLGFNFHGGCTYFSKNSRVSSGIKDRFVEIGCDFQHYGDELFSEIEEMNDNIMSYVEEIFLYFNK